MIKSLFLNCRSWIEHHRRLAVLLSALFILFELSRAASIGQFLLPGWSEAANERVVSISSHPPIISAVAFMLAALFFAVPMAGLIYGAAKLRRGLSRYWTSLNRHS